MKKLLLALFIAPMTFVNAQGWVEQNSGFTTPSRGIEYISIVSPTTVWAKAYDGSGGAANVQEFTKTTDGGTTWTPGTINVGNADLNLTQIRGINGTTAWIGAFDTDAGLGGAYKTTNSGATWTLMTPGKYVGATSWFNLVYFFDEMHGLTMGDPSSTAASARFEVYYTSDGGATWAAPSVIGTGAFPSAAGDYSYTDMYAAAGGVLWFGTNTGRIFKTTNMGVNWTVIPSSATPITDFDGARMYFADANNGVIIKAGLIYRTTDGGSTWGAGVAYTGFPNVTYIPGTSTMVSTGAASGSSGSSYSPNNGTSFTPIDTNVQHTAVSFYDTATGWTGGFVSPLGTGGISKFSGNLRVSDVNKAQVSVTPNPTNGVMTVTGFNVSNVKVYDLTGKQVYNKDFAAIADASVDLSSLKTGAYMLTATADNGATKTLKVLRN